jgi:hypothetical protein
MTKGSDAENEGSCGGRSCPRWSAVRECRFKNEQGSQRRINSSQCKWWRSHTGSSLHGSGARLSNDGVMSAAIVLGHAADLYIRGGTIGLLTLRAGAMMARRGSRGRRFAQHRAYRPRHRQRGQDGQHDDTDRSLCQAHGSSIPRAHSRTHFANGEVAFHRETRLNRRALPMTDTELNVMAALAIIGLSSSPNQGYRIPAAIGTPATLRERWSSRKPGRGPQLVRLRRGYVRGVTFTGLQA